MKSRLIYGVIVLIVVFSAVAFACSNPTTTTAPAAPAAPATTSKPAAAPPPATTASSPVATATAKPVASPTTAPSAKPAQTITIRWASQNPDGSTEAQASRLFGDKVTQMSGGRVKFDYYFGGSLAKPGEVLAAIQRGVADMGPSSHSQSPGELPMGTFLQCAPFTPADAAVEMRVVQRMWTEVPGFNKELEKWNQRYVFPAVTGSYEINTVKPAPTLASLKGLKLGAAGAYIPKWAQAAGAVGGTGPMTERILAMQTGVINGHILSIDNIYKLKMYEVAPNLTIAKLGAQCWTSMSINMDTWNKMPKDIQDIFGVAGKEAALYYGNAIRDGEASQIADMKTKGVSVFYMSDEDRAKWAEAMPDFPADWARQMEPKGIDGWALWQKFEAVCKEEGHTFPRKFGVKS